MNKICQQVVDELTRYTSPIGYLLLDKAKTVIDINSWDEENKAEELAAVVHKWIKKTIGKHEVY